jgi:hypothetical protein
MSSYGVRPSGESIRPDLEGYVLTPEPPSTGIPLGSILDLSTPKYNKYMFDYKGYVALAFTWQDNQALWTNCHMSHHSLGGANPPGTPIPGAMNIGEMLGQPYANISELIMKGVQFTGFGMNPQNPVSVQNAISVALTTALNLCPRINKVNLQNTDPVLDSTSQSHIKGNCRYIQHGDFTF